MIVIECIFDFIWCLFFPDLFIYLFNSLICKIKRHMNDGRRCFFWNCKQYLYCSHNQKCINDVNFSIKPIYPLRFYVFDALLFLSMLLFGVTVMVIFHVVFGIIVS